MVTVADLGGWAERYAHRRYGPRTAAAADAVGAAWRLLQGSVFAVEVVAVVCDTHEHG